MTYQVRKTDYRSSGPAVYWGPLLFKTTLHKSHFDDLLRDTNIVYNEKIDYRRNLAGKISFEYAFNDTLCQNWNNILKKYLAEYFDCLKSYRGLPDSDVANYFHDVKLILEKLQLYTMWANFQKKLEYNPIHDHSGYFSFVAYVDVPEVLHTEECIDTSHLKPGDIQFINHLESDRFKVTEPSDSEKFLMEMLRSTNYASFSPVSGDLFIFPSYLTHHVAAFKTDVTRVSVSGNWRLGE